MGAPLLLVSVSHLVVFIPAAAPFLAAENALPWFANSRARCRDSCCRAVLANPLPDLRTMDRNIGIDIEAQLHLSSANPEYGNLEQTMEAFDSPDHYGFLALPRQH
jgi:hypothetical protein